MLSQDVAPQIGRLRVRLFKKEKKPQGERHSPPAKLLWQRKKPLDRSNWKYMFPQQRQFFFLL